MRIKECVHLGVECLQEVTPIPQKETMLLLCDMLGKEMSWLVAHDADEIIPNEWFYTALKRRANHEPLEYILGRASFYDREFSVDARVLIPRPETEILVDKAVLLAKTLPEKAHIVEIGSGSGIVSIMLALMLPDVKITAVDISSDALHVSQSNAMKHGVHERISFVQGSYLDAIHESIDMIVSNPPYIAHDEPLGKGLSFEPSLALFGGIKGDEMLCHIIDLFMQHRVKALVCEMGYDQKEPLYTYCVAKGLEPTFYQDLAGLDRGFYIQEKR
ncbi:peptide chain release factor N(5)-glutamine methyltransferase [Sulfurospirillum barnesii]|uniref:peptide chain release factor N(5)-glutamine methyltransferase n=1 Tax=Sulfurospirillum barnesii (strain ATCC 700032 / DSM 10660 / SES-3) TaxID=760154 RepID=I3XXV9_SULBS|nr:peptide chain release factor N(5)-glutamine methyltransferase [Sulfurospirillum barnesii]AFL68783.1 protein-(glutamine-N5) methyltransferase, release factor-specific [Sulfurospirillum barnesii SES-3]